MRIYNDVIGVDHNLLAIERHELSADAPQKGHKQWDLPAPGPANVNTAQSLRYSISFLNLDGGIFWAIFNNIKLARLVPASRPDIFHINRVYSSIALFSFYLGENIKAPHASVLCYRKQVCRGSGVERLDSICKLRQ